MSSGDKFNPGTFREVLGHFPTGVVIVTGIDDAGKPVGMVVGSFTSVSMDPPIVGFLPALDSSRWIRLRTASSYCINVLASSQSELCRRFARKGAQDPFEGIAWDPSGSGAPILPGVVAAIECTPRDTLDAGDHQIVLADVDDLRVLDPTSPLIFFQGGFGGFVLDAVSATDYGGWIEVIHAAERGRGALKQMANELGLECTLSARIGGNIVAVAVETAEAKTPETTVGSYVPLMPPLGELFVATNSHAEVEAWLARRSPLDEVSAEEYTERLATTRSRGWAIAAAGPYADGEFAAALHRHTGVAPTPAELRKYAQVIATVSAGHAPVTLSEGEHYDIAAILTPVRAETKSVELVLRATGLPAHASASQLRKWVDAALYASQQIELSIRG